jgi:hypothetical protein
VRIQVLWSLLAPRLPAMCGSATFAMLVSRTSMKAAMATTTAIAQGFARGRQTCPVRPEVAAGTGAELPVLVSTISLRVGSRTMGSHRGTTARATPST